MRRQAGLTMIELIVTATVAAIIIVAVIAGVTEIEKLNRNARAQTIAVQLVQQELEKVRNTPYANISTGTSDLVSQLAAYPNLESPRSFTKTVTIVDAGGMKQVDFALSYTIYHRSKQVQLTTQISHIGINQ
jgi:Tfp pilus assembly protein PilV